MDTKDRQGLPERRLKIVCILKGDKVSQTIFTPSERRCPNLSERQAEASPDGLSKVELKWQ